MGQLTLFGGLLALVSTLTDHVSAQSSCPGTGDERFQLKLGDGYRYSKLATGLRSPRHMAVDTEGNLLVAEAGGGTVRRFVLEDQNDIVCAQSSTQIISEQATNHGIVLSADGKTLFTSNLATVKAYDYNAATGQVGQGKDIVTGMSVTGGHPTRTVTTSKWNPDIILVARGSLGNIDAPTTDQAVARSIIKSFSISEGLQTPLDYARDGEVLAWGLRNIVGVTEDPVFGGIWSVENQMDQVHINGRDIHNDNPAERLSYHGVLNDTENRYKGLNYGYPSCVPAWDPENVGIDGLLVGSLFKPDGVPEIPDGECANRMTGRLHFPAHTAPLDIKFNSNGTAAYIAFHGSWNRNPADGYRVMRVDFGPDGQPVQPVTSKTAQVPVFENSQLANCPMSCFRPAGLAFDQKGRLFVSSDTSGDIYVIYGA
ncbi:soluble quino protein glucose/sorbosone dehydrogenase [Corynascus similis CBS 632.67]